MDGDEQRQEIQSSGDKKQSPGYFERLIAFLAWGSLSDWSTANRAYAAAETLGDRLAAQGDTPYPNNFEQDYQVHPGRFGGMGPQHYRGKPPTTEVQAAMDWASKSLDFDPDYTRRLIYLESAHTFDPNIVNHNAHGLGQFMATTWNSTMEGILENHPEVAKDWLKRKGILAKDDPSDNEVAVAWKAATLNYENGHWTTEIWRDADLNALATVAYAKHNEAILRRMGIEHPTVGQIYAMHMLGEGDGAKLLTAIQDGQSNIAAASVVSPTSLAANHLSGKSVGQVMAAFDSWMASMPEFTQLASAEVPRAIAGANADAAIGTALGERTAEYSDTPYLWGGNSLGRSGGIDCSHYAWNDTIAIMKRVNATVRAKTGMEIYDTSRMAQLLRPTAAHQYEALRDAGYAEYSAKDIAEGNLPPGTLIFVNRGKGIIHVAQVTLGKDGALTVSESGGHNEGAGVHSESYGQWFKEHADATLYAIDPFAVHDEKERTLLEASFHTDEKPKGPEIKTAGARALPTLSVSGSQHPTQTAANTVEVPNQMIVTPDASRASTNAAGKKENSNDRQPKVGDRVRQTFAALAIEKPPERPVANDVNHEPKKEGGDQVAVKGRPDDRRHDKITIAAADQPDLSKGRGNKPGGPTTANSPSTVPSKPAVA